jgi:hypothetical protein
MSARHSEGAVAFRPLNLGRKLRPPSGAGTVLAVSKRPVAEAPRFFRLFLSGLKATAPSEKTNRSNGCAYFIDPLPRILDAFAL